jgi:hypothetical protein
MTSRDAENYSSGDQPGLQKDPQEWKSGDDPATPSQMSYLKTLAEQTDEDAPDGLTKAAASEKIDEFRAKVGLDDDGNAGADIGIGAPAADQPDAGAGGNVDGTGDEPFMPPPTPSNTAR